MTTDEQNTPPLTHTPLEELGRKYTTLCAQLGEREYQVKMHQADAAQLIEQIKEINNQAAKLKELPSAPNETL